jgi:hypothetical protein
MVLMAIGAGLAVPSPVNKTVVNLLHNFAENGGPFLTEDVPDLGRVTYSMGGYVIAPGTQETANDHAVRRARELGTWEFLAGQGEVLFELYWDRLGQVVKGAAGGLRFMVNELVLFFFGVQVMASLCRRGDSSTPTLAMAGGALAYYLGPVVLLRGDQPTHYLLLALPLFLVVGARGVITCGKWIGRCAEFHCGGLARFYRRRRGFILALLLTPPLCLTVRTYVGVLAILRDYQAKARVEQAAMDALHLEGKTVACSNMNWFVDRNIRAVLLPYATVPEVGKYVRARGAGGVLVWDHETQLYFRTPLYGSLTAFDRALRNSPLFGPPQVSGAWHWYPVRQTQSLRRKS